MTNPEMPLKIIIVGGGTAGWLSAGFLFSQLPQTTNRAVQITLIEASDIPTVGVGEATIPSLRQTLAACGVSEIEFLKSCDATFKHGIQFTQWRKAPKEDPGEAYFHPFGDPIEVAGLNPARQWSRLEPEERGAFADLFSVQAELAKSGRAPKHLRDRPYDGALAYAYHLDAGKLAQFLKERFRKRGINHVIGTVEDVALGDDGVIASLTLQSGDVMTADLYIDCTGFAARLINSDKTNVFEDKSPILFVDKAVTTRIPHDGIQAINGYTKCTAQTSGWIWDIALQERRGIGHVYSSRHTSEEDAKRQLAQYIGQPEGDLDIRALNMRIGYHRQQWRGNCVAIGLSSGFLEPLESTGIYLIEMANWALADMIPRFLSGARPQDHFSRIMSNHYENITDFLKLHYCLTDRRDTAFWRDNCEADTIPVTLQEKLNAWEDNIPSVYDFDRTTQCFSQTNFQFVLFGMGWRGHKQPTPRSERIGHMLQELATRRQRLREFVVRDTVTNAEIFSAIGTN